MGNTHIAEKSKAGLLGHWLGRWVLMICQRAKVAMILILAVTAIAAWISLEKFNIHSGMTDLITQDTQWRKDFNAFKQSFPQLIDTAVIVVSGTSLKSVEETTQQIYQQLLSQPNKFSAVYSGAADGFFRDHALLYQSIDELYDTSDRLAEAQTILTAVAEDESLIGILDLIVEAVDEAGKVDGEEAPVGLEKVVNLLTQSAQAVAYESNKNSPDAQTIVERAEIAWTDEVFNRDGEMQYQLIFLKGQADYGQDLPHKQTVDNIRQLLQALPTPENVSVRLTGEVVLATEEIAAAKIGVRIAAVVSLLLLLVILTFGVRSLQITIACLSMVVIGAIWTSAFAMTAIGSYNTLSLLFVVMFFGLGVDFCLHFSLRFQEALSRDIVAEADGVEHAYFEKREVSQALGKSAKSVGRAIWLCVITTSIGFLAFSLTDYRGLAELGIISAAGMLIAAFLTFTLLPALFMLVPMPRKRFQPAFKSIEKFVARLSSRPQLFLVGLALVSLIAVLLAINIRFDFSVLALRDKQSESMSTLIELQEAGQITDYSLSMLTTDMTLDSDLIERLNQLPSVEKVRTAADYLPTDLDEKQLLLEDLRELLWSAIEPTRQASEVNEQQLSLAVARLVQALERQALDNRATDSKAIKNPIRDNSSDLPKAYEHLHQAIKQLTENAERQDLFLGYWQQASISNLVEELQWLRSALMVEPPNFQQLPVGLQQRLVSPDGLYHSVIMPVGNIVETQDARRFINEVQSLSIAVTGRPIIEMGIGEIVSDSFKTALLIALIGILLVLLMVMRDSINIIWVLLPLALTAIFSLAAMTLLDISFNMANVLVLPLIFGLGVDNGIHVIDRYNHRHNVNILMHSSTPKAVLLSALTTIATFSSLSLSPHVGTATIGYVLTISVLIMLVITVIVLPVILDWVSRLGQTTRPNNEIQSKLSS